jgi:hypothetical protein
LASRGRRPSGRSWPLAPAASPQDLPAPPAHGQAYTRSAPGGIGKRGRDKDRHFYDQIAWFSEPDGTSLLEDMAYNRRAGSFDFLPHIMAGLTRNEVSWRISDHYPLWTEFRIPAHRPLDAGAPAFADHVKTLLATFALSGNY